MGILELLANPFVVGVGTAIAGGLVSWRALKYREGRLEKDLDAARSQIQQQRSQIEQLEKTVANAPDGDAKPVAWRSAIVSILNDLTDRSGADRATLYVPVENKRGSFLGLVILATAHETASASFVGSVFSGRDARAVICFLDAVTVHSTATAFSIDGFMPSSTYAECLQASALTGDGRKVGVVQLLSDKEPIDAQAAARIIESQRAKLIDLAGRFTGANGQALEAAAIRVPRDSERGTALSLDISNSSGLFVDEARSFVTRKFMGELMRSSVDEINRRGGVFEAFTGDGLMASFPADERNSAQATVDCCVAVEHCFRELVAGYRTDLKHLKAQLSLRFGLSTGAIHPIAFSFGQLRTASVIGRTPSLAKRMGDLGSREYNSICADTATYQELAEGSRQSFTLLHPPSEKLRVGCYERRL